MRQGKFESGKHMEPDELSSKDHKREIMLYVHDIVYLMVGMILVFLLVFRIAVVEGNSMYSTLVDGDYLLLLSNIFYTQPEQGDIIVACKEDFKDGEPIVKRVIATEGQEVDIDFHAGVVYVDGIALDEPYIYSPTDHSEGMAFPLTVEPGCIFVMGDNRGISKDSRDPEIGLIDRREILGKAIFLFFPGTNGGNQPPQFHRIGALS